jgi:hypothetical protein
MVVAIQRPKEKEDPIASILKGVQLAAGILNIKEKIDPTQTPQQIQQAELTDLNIKAAEQKALATAEAAKGQISPKELIAASDKFERVAVDDERSIGNFHLPNDPTPFGMAPRVKNVEKPMTTFQKESLNLSKLRNIRLDSKDVEQRAKIKNESIRKLGNAILKSGMSESVTALKKIDSMIGGIDGDDDIPGVGGVANMANVPLVGGAAEALLSDEGKEVRQAVGGLRNIILKMRSGGAVTPQEADRLLEEIGQGVFRTDAQLRKGLANVRDTIAAKLGIIEASADPEALAEFADRPNSLTSADPIFSTSKFIEPFRQQPDPASFGSGTAIGGPSGVIDINDLPAVN